MHLPIQQTQSHPTLTRIAAAVALLVLAQGAHAQQSARGSAPDEEARTLDSVVVIGSSRQDATVLTSSAPIDVITPQQLKETGAVSLNQALSQLHPSFNFPQGQNAVKGQGVRAASLRGVSPAYTLILVNGKRRHTTAQLTGTDPWPAATVVDLNAIPLAAVARIEVLRDGAAAQYGSDAIAGVINIVLRENAGGGDVSAHRGGYSDGGGRTTAIQASTGVALGGDGFLHASIDRLKNANVDRSEADWRQLFPNGDARNETFNKKTGQWGQASRDNWSALINAALPIGAKRELYGWVNYADKSSANFVNPERVVKATTANPSVTDGTRLGENDVLAIYPNGYQPWMNYRAKDIAAVAGLRVDGGALGRFDLAASWGRNETARTTHSTVNPAYGADSPTSFYLGSWKSDSTNVSLDYVNEVRTLLAEPVTVSSGLLARHERWATGDLGDPKGYSGGPLAGKTVGSLYPGTPFANDTSRIPVSGSSTSGIKSEDAADVTRNVAGAYLGVDLRLSKQWELGATARYEHYSDFGATRDFKLTSRYEFSPAIAVRGTVSSGFHAPSLAALGFQSTGSTSNWSNTGTGVLSPGQTRQFKPNDPAAAAVGAKPLSPEKSRTFSLGAVLRPDSSSSLSIDAYRLKVDDVIIVTETLQGPTVTAAFNRAGLAGFTQTSYYTNGWNAQTDGIDIVGRTQFDVAGGKLDVRVSGSLLDTEVSNVHRLVDIGGSSILAVGGAKVRDAETGTPKNKLIVGARYAAGPWVLDASYTRFGEYRYNVGDVANSVAPNGNRDQVFAPESYVDFSMAYTWSEAWRFDVNVQNVFNKYPDKYITNNRSSGINPYSFIAPNGASGRFVYAGVTYRF
ncbi:MAG: TonB-dependent receptor plug domain-containing protein [Gammaproteobacteria bacterium]